jgi:hypothetical protein
MKCRAKTVGREFSVRAFERRDLEAAERRMGAAFAGQDVRGLMRQDLIAGPAMHKRGRNVAHSAGGQEYRGFLAEQTGHPLAQQVHAGIVADLFVADLGPRHRLAHGRRRAGLRVRQQVDADRRGIACGRGVEHGHRFLAVEIIGQNDEFGPMCIYTLDFRLSGVYKYA